MASHQETVPSSRTGNIEASADHSKCVFVVSAVSNTVICVVR